MLRQRTFPAVPVRQYRKVAGLGVPCPAAPAVLRLPVVHSHAAGRPESRKALNEDTLTQWKGYLANSCANTPHAAA